MKDVQNSIDKRGIAIQKVGISRLALPFLVRQKDGGMQSVLATIQMTVALPKECKGTHMSRFVEILSEWRQKPISSLEMKGILADAIVRLEADEAQLDIAFKYFLEKEAPASKMKGLVDIDCRFAGTLTKEGAFDFLLEVAVPYTSLCPCSKEISAYGAHNQRGTVCVKVRYDLEKMLWIEDIAAAMEAQASSPVYSLLKRQDEKVVTEEAYDNPKFVEDILRDAVLTMRSIDGVRWFEITCENQESIHNHNAYASHAEFV
ncbi:MAG: GTP cyclohydrolase I FolE2 [Selenomonadales bacterium]|nr:GTP cyclohydrolase I FolE2 [Selenomonadales bacterium]